MQRLRGDGSTGAEQARQPAAEFHGLSGTYSVVGVGDAERREDQRRCAVE